MNRTLYAVVVLIILFICTILVKQIMLLNTTFIGSKSRRYVIWYYCNIIVKHILFESILIMLSRQQKAIIVIAAPYMFCTIYITLNIITYIFKIANETSKNTLVIPEIKRNIINKRRFRVSCLGILTRYSEKAEFNITRHDAIKLDKLLKDGSIIYKVHYFKSSKRLYGLEMLRYNKEVLK